MKNKLKLLAISLFLSGCGGGGSSTSTDIETPNLFLEQWTINKNTTFYSQNNINNNAHINMQNISSTYTGKNIRVAVIDNGFDINHPEIKDKIVATASFDTAGNTLGTDVSHTNSTDIHGTAVAGIIASKDDNKGIRGVAPNVELILIKLPTHLSDNAVMSIFNYAISNGADVINCSWGTGAVSDTVRSYLNNLAKTARGGKGVAIVFASGNGNTNLKDDEASIKNVIAVGATSKDNLRANYSDYGKDLDIMAPGGETFGVTTLDPLGTAGKSNDGYNRYNETSNDKNVSFKGTSASAPILTGVIALGLEKKNNLNLSSLLNTLQYSTDIVGQNTPYLNEMISSSSTTPTITGQLGSTGNSQIKIKLKSHDTNITYGPYSLTTINGDNTFSSTITSAIPENNYTIELVDNTDTVVWATDEHFEVNSAKTITTDITRKKSDFYGYGKINAERFLNNIN